ncbi:MAG: serine/threonine-protein kinase [Muribaculaceae bacterium]|nr:serine/threonine-protein kinase [Muribaculaceae bacterium]
MERASLLKLGTSFIDLDIVRKLSTHHDGKREVYRCMDGKGYPYILIVYDLDSAPFNLGANKTGWTDVTLITEIDFLAHNQDLPGLPRLIGYGCDEYEGHRLAWVKQEHIYAKTLADIMKWHNGRTPREAIHVLKILGDLLEKIIMFTRGSGVYNLSPDNILVIQDSSTDYIKDIYVTGLSNLGFSGVGGKRVDGSTLDPHFRAPETYDNDYSYRADIYSLGMIFTLILLGYPDCEILERNDNKLFREAMLLKIDDNFEKMLKYFICKSLKEEPFERHKTTELFKHRISKLIVKKKTTSQEEIYFPSSEEQNKQESAQKQEDKKSQSDDNSTNWN